MKRVKQIIAECSEKDVIIIRDHGMELRTSNVNPYKKALATYWNNGVKDYWRDGEKTMIIVLK